MTSHTFNPRSFAGGVVTTIGVLLVTAVCVMFYMAYAPFDPQRTVNWMEDQGLTQVHITRSDASEGQEGSYKFEAVVRSRPDCVVTGFGVHNVDYTWQSLDGFDQNWYEIDHTDYISHNWPPDYVTVGQLTAEHPEVCQTAP